MPSIEFIAEISSSIVNCKDKIAQLNNRLERLSTAKCFSAKMELEIGDRRSTIWEYLSKEEVGAVLTRRIKEKEKELYKLEIEFENSKS